MALADLIYRLKRPYHWVKTGLAKGLVSQVRYGFPQKKLTIIAITGTDGKTTTSSLVYHLLKIAGFKVGLISTVGAFIGEEKIDTGFHTTSPQPQHLYGFMSRLVAEGYTHLVLEVTSQGLYQYRTWGIHPHIAGLTNITSEHLDYHLTYDNYVAAKSELLKKAQLAIINESDQSYLKVKRHLKNSAATVETYSNQEPLPPKFPTVIKTRFPEAYNQMNARLAVKVGLALEIPAAQLLEGLASFPNVPGRKQVLSSRQGVKVVIDFAHTPNALASILSELRTELIKSSTPGKLIAVYGCAGLRDHIKRPVMGKIGADLADTVVFTAEDPRTEDVWTIIRQMKENLTADHSKVVSIADRAEAITFALRHIAKKGDTVAVLGKGHEQSMCYGKVEYPWSDEAVVRDTINVTTK